MRGGSLMFDPDVFEAPLVAPWSGDGALRYGFSDNFGFQDRGEPNWNLLKLKRWELDWRVWNLEVVMGRMSLFPHPRMRMRMWEFQHPRMRMSAISSIKIKLFNKKINYRSETYICPKNVVLFCDWSLCITPINRALGYQFIKFDWRLANTDKFR